MHDSYNSLPHKRLHEREYAKVLIVDDHDMVRMGLLAIMAVDPIPGRYIQWFESTNLHDSIELFTKLGNIDLVLLDLNLADCKGLQGLRKYMEKYPRANVAIMSGTHDDFVIGQARSLGAIGYLSKVNSPEATRAQLNELIRQVIYAKSNRLTMVALSGTENFPALSSYDRVAELGSRHIEILELVLSGCSNQEISNETKLTLGTVKNYVSTILLALDVKSRSHLISLFR